MALARRNGFPKRRLACAPVLAIALVLAPARAAADDPTPDKSVYTLFNPTPDALMRAFSTDRPPKANSPYTVDAGHFQYETDGFVYDSSTLDGVKTTGWTVVDPTLKLGLTNDTDIELQLTPYESQRIAAQGQPASSRGGTGDTYLRLKHNLLGNDGGDVALALLPYVKFPTARSGLGNGKVEGGLILPVDFAVAGGFSVVVMPELDWLKDPADASDHLALDFLVNVSHALAGRWTWYTELFTTQSTRGQGKAVYTFDAALTYALRPNLQLDFGGNFALDRVVPQVQIYTGISQRF